MKTLITNFEEDGFVTEQKLQMDGHPLLVKFPQNIASGDTEAPQYMQSNDEVSKDGCWQLICSRD